MLEQLIQEAVAKMPSKMQKEIKSTKWRKDQMRKHGADSFLDPVGLSFPVKYNSDKYDCRMLHAAAFHAVMYSKKGSSLHNAKYYQDILAKAKKLYADNKCENEIKVKIQEGDDTEVGLMDVLEIYELSE